MTYSIEISNFEGPLDLLLHLIKKSEMNIEDVSIEEITKQYLEYIHIMEDLNLNIASDYLVMAAELLEIKSKNLLPQRNEFNNEEDEEYLKENLIDRLKEYEKYKNITESLKILESIRSEMYTKDPTDLGEYSTNDEVKEEFNIEDLITAFNSMIERKEIMKPLNTKITNKEYSLSQRNKDIKNILKLKEEIDFIDLFDNFNKDFIIITFLSILTLSKEKEVKIIQEKNFNNIILRRGDLWNTSV